MLSPTVALTILLLLILPNALAAPPFPPLIKYFPLATPIPPTSPPSEDPALPAPQPQQPLLNARTCGTSNPSNNLRSALAQLRAEEPLDNNNLWSARTFSARILSQPLHKRAATPLVTIPLYLHIVDTPAAATPGSPSYISDAQVEQQVAYLRSAYALLSIAFDLRNTTRTTNATWAGNGDDLAMKRALRQGAYDSLNVYFQSNLKSNGDDGLPAGATLLGLCTLPVTGVSAVTAPARYVRDGCNVLSGTMPGGRMNGYNLGATAAHEMGHWLGLLHTFEDETCDAASWGDYVADTPQQAVPTEGCPARGSQDSCPNSGVAEGWSGLPGQGPNPYGPQGYSGVDNTRNYMDYSSDVCYEGWTAGQGARVVNAWKLWREGR
ncbi:uncharacterized protein HMPREF1541_08611 [Cyphellophora europaea CBS 101466]|uniref:Peptidase M43 pregnancy-associated plasma-A domain-containing protein n=1 Tax=Cyphellophora europaea (strain CBS 101466) TaxID=1220924 RepID=W2RKS6_CYPE1|nr:uncharacterized protein HMPREF1541_08611 [Cyphellophora europaea CBS 101466]ETN36334.1 hypothetical protein HMPREF1541_08611 [Cyphellophora europaea CBS 101466]